MACQRPFSECFQNNNFMWKRPKSKSNTKTDQPPHVATKAPVLIRTLKPLLFILHMRIKANKANVADPKIVSTRADSICTIVYFSGGYAYFEVKEGGSAELVTTWLVSPVFGLEGDASVDRCLTFWFAANFAREEHSETENSTLSVKRWARKFRQGSILMAFSSEVTTLQLQNLKLQFL